MGGSAGFLRVRDVRAGYRLIGECRDLGHDPTLWQTRMCEGLRGMIGGAAATGGEGTLEAAGIVPVSSVEAGLDATGKLALASYMRAGGPAADPFVLALMRLRKTSATHTRRQLVRDSVYYGSPVFQRYLRPAGADHRLASIHRTADARGITIMQVHRPPRERDFSARERALLAFFHAELAPLVGRALTSAAGQPAERLSPRLRQTLACLMEGDSEKQAAARLGVSAATLHEYVTALYRRFGVRSRGQLLALMLKRSGAPGRCHDAAPLEPRRGRHPAL
jgi:DNA-binding CsgD family transcriptional regulator